MVECSGKPSESPLGVGDIAVKAYGARIEMHEDGSVDAYTQSAVRVHLPANDIAATVRALCDLYIGREMDDGTIYAGVSPDTGKAMYVTPRDAPGTYTFNEAARYARNLDAHGHHDFRVPTKGELNVLWENRNKGKLAGTFNETGSGGTGWYWSSACIILSAWAQRFSDGHRDYDFRNYDSSLRCVR